MKRGEYYFGIERRSRPSICMSGSLAAACRPAPAIMLKAAYICRQPALPLPWRRPAAHAAALATIGLIAEQAPASSADEGDHDAGHFIDWRLALHHGEARSEGNV